MAHIKMAARWIKVADVSVGWPIGCQLLLLLLPQLPSLLLCRMQLVLSMAASATAAATEREHN